MPNLLWFEWKRAADGYSVEEFNPDEVDWDVGYTEDGHLKLKEGASLSMEILVLLAKGWISFAKKKSKLLMPIGRTTQSYRPLDEYPVLFREFADTACSPAGVKAFADKYGYLTDRGILSQITPWYPEIRRMGEAIYAWKQGLQRRDWSRLIRLFAEHTKGTASVKLDRVWGTDRVALYVVPESLLDALWLQFAQAVSANTQLRGCARCGAWFAYGTGTGRRKSAHYCSDRCRKAAHRHQKEMRK